MTLLGVVVISKGVFCKSLISKVSWLIYQSLISEFYPIVRKTSLLMNAMDSIFFRMISSAVWATYRDNEYITEDSWKDLS